MTVPGSFLKYFALRTLVLIVLTVCASGVARATPAQLPEHKVAAGLVYNFLKYTSWPAAVFPTPDAPLKVCLLGGDSLGGALEPLQGRTAQMRPITMHEIDEADSLKSCHAVFIHRSKEENLDAIIEVTHALPILLLSDIPDFTRKGGMVEFSQDNKKSIRLNLNHEAIAQAGLKVSRSLVRLAEQH